MNVEGQVDYVLNSCFVAVGQAVGARTEVEYSAVVWWHDRYRDRFLRAMTVAGTSWSEDRERLITVSHLLGERALRYSCKLPSLNAKSAMKASQDVETACRIRAKRQ
jgi:hypothetical protein